MGSTQHQALAAKLADYSTEGGSPTLRKRHRHKEDISEKELIAKAQALRDEGKLPENSPFIIEAVDGGNPVITGIEKGFLAVFERELKKSIVRRNPKKFAFLGGFLVLAITFGVAVAIMLPIQMFTTVAILPAVISAISFLSFLNLLGPIFGILALAGMLAIVMLIPYGLAVWSAHKATQPRPPSVLENTLNQKQEEMIALREENARLKQAEADATAMVTKQDTTLHEAQAKLLTSTEKILKKLEDIPFVKINKETADKNVDTLDLPPPPPPKLPSFKKPPVPPSTDHSQISTNNSGSNPVTPRVLAAV